MPVTQPPPEPNVPNLGTRHYLHRIQQQLSCYGIYLPRSTQSDCLIACTRLLRPLVEHIKQVLLSTSHIFTDDMILPLKNDDKSRQSLIQVKLWVYAALYARGIKEVGCIVRCRRKIFEAAELESTPGPANQALALIGQLYQVKLDVHITMIKNSDDTS